jgi:hypothetical protein
MIYHVFLYSEGFCPTILIGSLFSSEKAAPDFTQKTKPSLFNFAQLPRNKSFRGALFCCNGARARSTALSRPVTRLPLPLKLIMIWHSEKFF